LFSHAFFLLDNRYMTTAGTPLDELHPVLLKKAHIDDVDPSAVAEPLVCCFFFFFFKKKINKKIARFYIFFPPSIILFILIPRFFVS
jgi:hypothetical protein